MSTISVASVVSTPNSNPLQLVYKHKVSEVFGTLLTYSYVKQNHLQYGYFTNPVVRIDSVEGCVLITNAYGAWERVYAHIYSVAQYEI